jgi:hypothetical protein
MISADFHPESPKRCAPYRRVDQPSAAKRTLWLIFTLVVLVALYFAGCGGVTLEMLRPG